MRCPTCGTENEPDSRFCGNCGAKVGSVAPGLFATTPGAGNAPATGRVAPTQKIPPDARFDAARGVGSAATPAGRDPLAAPRSHPPSMPPPVLTPLVQPAAAKPVSAGSSGGRSGASPSRAPVQIPPQQPAQASPSPAPSRLDPISPQTIQRPSNGAMPPPSSAPRPAMSAQVSMVPPRGRNWGLIVFVFLIDLGLATAGLIMLQRGLVRDDEVPVQKATTP